MLLKAGEQTAAVVRHLPLYMYLLLVFLSMADTLAHTSRWWWSPPEHQRQVNSEGHSRRRLAQDGVSVERLPSADWGRLPALLDVQQTTRSQVFQRTVGLSTGTGEGASISRGRPLLLIAIQPRP
jgi:hypothetical protein